MKHNKYLQKKRRWEIMTKEKCWTFLWAVADVQYVVDSDYLQRNISDEKILLFYLCI